MEKHLFSVFGWALLAILISGIYLIGDGIHSPINELYSFKSYGISNIGAEPDDSYYFSEEKNLSIFLIKGQELWIHSFDYPITTNIIKLSNDKMIYTEILQDKTKHFFAPNTGIYKINIIPNERLTDYSITYMGIPVGGTDGYVGFGFSYFELTIKPFLILIGIGLISIFIEQIKKQPKEKFFGNYKIRISSPIKIFSK